MPAQNLLATLWPRAMPRPPGWELPGTIRDIVIVGGGFTGATLACALADGKRRVSILEARNAIPNRFAGELILPTGTEELDRLGLVEPLLAAGGVRIDGFAVHHEPHPPAHLPFAAVRGARPSGLGIDHHTMVGVLRAEACRRTGVSLEVGVRVVDLLREGDRVVGVRTATGVEHRADLVLSAEGRHSRLRSELGFSAEPTTISMTAALRIPNGELPRRDHGHIFLGAWGPILAYPISADEVRMCFDLPRGVVVDGLRARLLDEYVPFVPEPLRAGLVATLRGDEPLQLAANQALFSPASVMPGAALVGDVGGCAHPLTAAGMTICLRDIRYLSDELHPGGSLARYEARRSHFVRSRTLLTAALYHVMKGGDPIARGLRDGLFRYWRSSRARSASLALLTGTDTAWHHFAREYAGVVVSAASALSARTGG